MYLLDTFFSSLQPSDSVASYVSDYFDWQNQRHAVDFTPSADDDVDLRTYLFDLYAKGADWATLKEQVAALKQFYYWAQIKGVIPNNPFDEYNFLHPLLAGEQTEPREQTLPSDPNEREMIRLRGLSQIVESLISSLDIHSALDNTLRELLKVMNLQTGWVSMLTDSFPSVFPAGDSLPHGFALATAYGLPASLERDDRRFLRQHLTGAVHGTHQQRSFEETAARARHGEGWRQNGARHRAADRGSVHQDRALPAGDRHQLHRGADPAGQLPARRLRRERHRRPRGHPGRAADGAVRARGCRGHRLRRHPDRVLRIHPALDRASTEVRNGRGGRRDPHRAHPGARRRAEAEPAEQPARRGKRRTGCGRREEGERGTHGIDGRSP